MNAQRPEIVAGFLRILWLIDYDHKHKIQNIWMYRI